MCQVLLLKTCEDKNHSIEIALQWVLNSKNYLTNRPPALEEPNISKLVADNLNAMRSARKAFMASESSEKLTRALKHNLRTYQDAICYWRYRVL